MEIFLLIGWPLLFDENIRQSGAQAILPRLSTDLKPPSKHKMYEDGLRNAHFLAKPQERHFCI